MKYEKPVLGVFSVSQDLQVFGVSPTAPGGIDLDDGDIQF